jgi:hypothetical protein
MLTALREASKWSFWLLTIMIRLSTTLLKD